MLWEGLGTAMRKRWQTGSLVLPQLLLGQHQTCWLLCLLTVLVEEAASCLHNHLRLVLFLGCRDMFPCMHVHLTVCECLT